MLKKINNHVYLDEVEINILTKYHIPFNNVTSYDELLLLIDREANDEELLDEELEELDYVANLISERKYYTQTNK
jgi:hypothetical protein